MTLQEVMAGSGLSMENIRFYEREGLVSPVTGGGGCRYYSQANLAELVRIRFLRSMLIPVNVIRALQNEEQFLVTYLGKHIEKLSQGTRDVSPVLKICKQMLLDKAEYKTMNIKFYGDMLTTQEELSQMAKIALRELSYDAALKENVPWRRFFAKFLDQLLYLLVFIAYIVLVEHKNLLIYLKNPWNSMLGTFFCVLMMVIVEPILLSTIETTPGRWILGLSVTKEDEKRLTYLEALQRTVLLAVCGMGLGISVVGFVLYIISFVKCKKGDQLFWEKGNMTNVKDGGSIRILSYTGAVAVFCVLYGLLITQKPTPIHKGPLTVAKFAENYNYYNAYYGISEKMNLDITEKYRDDKEEDGTEKKLKAHPTFTYQVENGELTGISFEQLISIDAKRFPDYREEMKIAMLSFYGAQTGFKPSNDDLKPLYDVTKGSYKDFNFSAYGVNTYFKLDYSGIYEGLLGSLLGGLGGGSSRTSEIKDVNELVSVKLVFEMKKEKE